MKAHRLFLVLPAILCAVARGGLPTGTPAASPSVGGEYKSEALYTAPDPAAAGGLRFTSPAPLTLALAVAEGNQEHVYRASLSADGLTAAFSNLPVSRYDLVLLAKDHYYEGVSLNRDENSLTPADLSSIEAIFSRSVPFFNQKRTERINGAPGDGGRAAALVQWMRIGGNLLNQNADLMTGHQIRSLRIAFLADVGPGWQVIATRELIRTDVFPQMLHGFLPVTYSEALGGIRVTDSIRDIGAVLLPQGGK